MKRTDETCVQEKFKRGRLFGLLVLAILVASCARMEYFPTGNVETGVASWYGPDFHGKSTSSKEIYDMHDMTAAHRTLPFGTYVMVTNLRNGRSVTVRINDRGPFVEDRIIDLSFAAAKVLDMIDSGTVAVKVEVLKGSFPKISVQEFSVQVGAFIIKDNAVFLKKELQKKYGNVYISLFETSNQIYYRVRIRARSSDSAHKIAQKLLKDGHTVIILEEQ